MAHMVGQVFGAYKILYYKDELRPEGRSHNKALHVTIKNKEIMIS